MKTLLLELFFWLFVVLFASTLAIIPVVVEHGHF